MGRCAGGHWRTWIAALVLASWAAGCSSDGSTDAPPTTDRPPTTEPTPAMVGLGLRTLPSCRDVEAMMRESALQAMNRIIDQSLAQARGSMRAWCRGGVFGGYFDLAVASPTGAVAAQDEAGGRASQVSGTNNQVAGVDEADFVKNDDKYLYVLRGGALRIIEAWPPQSARELARIAVPGEARKLFVFGDRALVYSSVPPAATSGAPQAGKAGWGRGARECTYGYDCDFAGDGNPTVISVIDLRKRSAPRRVRELHLTGSLLAARRIDATSFSVLSSPQVVGPELAYYPAPLPCTKGVLDRDALEAAYERLRAENREKIEKYAFADYLPTIEDLRFDDRGQIRDRRTSAECAHFYGSTLADGAQFTTLLSLDLLDDERPLHTSTIVSRPGAVYASADALYLAVAHQRQERCGWYAGLEQLEQLTTVHKFALDARRAAVRYVASGGAKGRVLNQFALDEHEGLLRVATTTGRVPDPKVHSTLTVLKHVGSELRQLGQLDGLAPTEDIRSVRFDGQRAFIVTFKKTDPLFVIDLTRPAAPRVLAELKIPGFSTYMQLMDERHLLTIGYDADDQGSFAWFQGVLLQIFDVSNPEDPRLVHRERIGTRGSSSEALTNHLAFNYFAPKQLLALPMTICEGAAGGGRYGDQMTFSGLLAYDVTAEKGFHLRGRVAHPAAEGVTCGNWWTNATSQVKRSIVMDDYVYSLSTERIKVNALSNLQLELRDISLADR